MLAPLPRGVNVKVNKGLIGMVEINSVGNGSAPTLDIWFQSSADNGMTWQDFANLHNPTATGTYLFPLSLGNNSSWPTTIPTPSDGQLFANTITQYGLGSRIRAKYQAMCGTGATQPWVFHVVVIPN